MRKFYLSIFVLLPFFISAQQFRGGIMAGFVSSQVAGDMYAGFDKAGLSGGFFTSLSFDPKSAIQMELYYVQKGSRYNANIDQPDFLNYKLRLNYADLPLLYQYKFRGFTFEGGLSASFLLGSYEEKDYYEIDLNEWKSVCFNSVIGIRFYITPSWNVAVRTVNSINSIRKNPVEGNVRRFGNKYGEYNDVLQLSLAYQFNLSKMAKQ
jgi:hypothetical protein